MKGFHYGFYYPSSYLMSGTRPACLLLFHRAHLVSVSSPLGFRRHFCYISNIGSTQHSDFGNLRVHRHCLLTLSYLRATHRTSSHSQETLTAALRSVLRCDTRSVPLICIHIQAFFKCDRMPIQKRQSKIPDLCNLYIPCPQVHCTSHNMASGLTHRTRVVHCFCISTLSSAKSPLISYFFFSLKQFDSNRCISFCSQMDNVMNDNLLQMPRRHLKAESSMFGWIVLLQMRT